MSRLILSRYENGQERVVVGWDHPASGYFWQIFTLEPEDGNYPEDFVEVEAGGGMWPGIPTLDQMMAEVPDEVKKLLTEKALGRLLEHRDNPESGRIIEEISS